MKQTLGNTAQFGKLIRREIFRQVKTWNAPEYCMYFKRFKPQNWRKRSAEARRRNCAVLPLFILAVALYLVSLCACGDQKIQSKQKQDSATQQVVQEQMANAAGETSAPPTAIPEQTQPAEALPDYEPAQTSGALDVDLTTLSSTMVYSEVYNMMYEPDRYVGKRIKMNGQFAVYEDPNTGAVYTACIIMDATACCSQGLEFVLAGEKTYPDDYPELGSEITVTGVFQLYDENGTTYCHLVDAEMAE